MSSMMIRSVAIAIAFWGFQRSRRADKLRAFFVHVVPRAGGVAMAVGPDGTTAAEATGLERPLVDFHGTLACGSAAPTSARIGAGMRASGRSVAMNAVDR